MNLGMQWHKILLPEAVPGCSNRLVDGVAAGTFNFEMAAWVFRIFSFSNCFLAVSVFRTAERLCPPYRGCLPNPRDLNHSG